MRELRMLRDNAGFIKKNKLQVIALTKENDGKFAESTIKDEKFPFKFYLGSKDLYSNMLKIDAVPYTVVFDKTGKQIDDEYGEQTIEELELLLK